MEFLSDPDSLIHQIDRFWPEHALLQGLLIVSLSLFIEDATTLFVATLISLDRMSFAEGMLWLSLGITLGDGILYYFGTLMRRGKMKTPAFMKDLRLPLSFIFGARFVPGTRLIAYTGAGLLRTPVGIFSLLAVSSSVLWTYGVLILIDRLNSSLLAAQIQNQYSLVFAGALVLLVGLEVVIGRLIKARNTTSEGRPDA